MHMYVLFICTCLLNLFLNAATSGFDLLLLKENMEVISIVIPEAFKLKLVHDADMIASKKVCRSNL